MITSDCFRLFGSFCLTTDCLTLSDWIHLVDLPISPFLHCFFRLTASYSLLLLIDRFYLLLVLFLFDCFWLTVFRYLSLIDSCFLTASDWLLLFYYFFFLADSDRLLHGWLRLFNISVSDRLLLIDWLCLTASVWLRFEWRLFDFFCLNVSRWLFLFFRCYRLLTLSYSLFQFDLFKLIDSGGLYLYLTAFGWLPLIYYFWLITNYFSQIFNWTLKYWLLKVAANMFRFFRFVENMI